MNGPTPITAAARVYRLLLADEIATALTTGRSVVATGTRDTDDVLDMTAVALAEAGIRVLSFRPPLDAASFISQLAYEWRSTANGAEETAVMLPKGSSERFAMLFHQAQTMVPETLRHLERLAQAWPGMQMAFAGLPGIATFIQSDEHPTLSGRVSVFVEVAGKVELQASAPSGESAAFSEVAVNPTVEPLPAPVEPLPAIAFAAVKTRTKQVKARGTKARRLAALAAVCLLAVAITAGTMGVPRLRRMADEIGGIGSASGSPSERSARLAHAAVAPPPQAGSPIRSAGDEQRGPVRDHEEVAVDAIKREEPGMAGFPAAPSAKSGEQEAALNPAPSSVEAWTQRPSAAEPAPVMAGPLATPDVSDHAVFSGEDQVTSSQAERGQSPGAPTQFVTETQPSARQIAAEPTPPPVAHDTMLETVSPAAQAPVEITSAPAQSATALPPQAFVAPQIEAAQPVIEAFQQAVPVSGPVDAPSFQADARGPAPAASSPPPNSPLFRVSLAMADAMTRRGRAMLDIGDVSAARLLLARAAGAGSGPAALTMGTTFDAATLDRIGAVGILPDPVQAAAWYRVAISMGENRARTMLDALSAGIVLAGPEATPQ